MSMDFEDRLRQAIERGQRRGDAAASEARQRQMTEDEYRRLHSQYRLQVSEYIENCLKRLPNYFPGFQFETVYGERGWGAACSRDDIRLPRDRGGRSTDYSRCEITVRPYSSLHVLELTGKGTIHNREVFSRNYFEELHQVDIQKFLSLVDAWTLEYAEMYSASR
jgi:hypothetical protein